MKTALLQHKTDMHIIPVELEYYYNHKEEYANFNEVVIVIGELI